jgi:nucleoside 2-deoxyribosyltransferase
MTPLVVYIAGPLGSRPAWPANIQRAIDAAQLVINAGHAPVVPHLLTHLDLDIERTYETWMRLDLATLAKCDAVLRIPGDSPGADREVAEAQRLGIPVVHSVADLTCAKRATEAA